MRRILSLLVVEALLVAMGVRGQSQGNSSTSSQLLIPVVASTTGRFAHGHSWHLSVDCTRRAHLLIDTYPKRRLLDFYVSEHQMDELERVLDKERFFSLQAEYGEEVFDGSTERITIVRGIVSRTVTIRYLMNWVYGDRSKLKEPARAVRVFQVIRGWFNDKDAVDLKKYDQMVLNAAEKA